MKYLGIDYGSKRVGIAVSDGGGEMAFPKAVFPRDAGLVAKVLALAKEESTEGIVVGESRDYKGVENPIMKDILLFVAMLRAATSIPVLLEPEFMTSAAAEHIQGKTALHDSSAAALILQSFLDKNREEK